MPPCQSQRQVDQSLTTYGADCPSLLQREPVFLERVLVSGMFNIWKSGARYRFGTYYGCRNDAVWVFHGTAAQFCSGVFSTKEKAEEFIAQHQLSGILTRYPLDTGVYDWAIAEGIFKPSRDYQSSPRFISRFTSASQEHFHYEMGIEGREGSEDDYPAGRPDVRDQ